MNLEIIFEVFSMIFCIFYLIVVGADKKRKNTFNKAIR